MSQLLSMEELGRNVHLIRATYSQGWNQRFLFSADHHIDNPKTDRKLIKRHLDKAVELNAPVFMFGDLFCAMQGNKDRRGSKSSIRPEDSKDDYFDRLVENALEFLKPYANYIKLICPGNHETAILKHNETNLTARIVKELNRHCTDGNQVFMGGFSGWIMVRMAYPSGGGSLTKVIYYHHGYGGDAPVTKGTIQTNRMGIYLPDADVVVSGHTHNSWVFPISRARLSQQGVVTIDEQLHIKLPTYKDEWQDGNGGWHIERGGPPKPTGAYWLELGLENEEVYIEAIKVR